MTEKDTATPWRTNLHDTADAPCTYDFVHGPHDVLVRATFYPCRGSKDYQRMAKELSGLRAEATVFRSLLAELQPFLSEERLRRAVDVALGRAPLVFSPAKEEKR
ncbi:MAG: hypothetical protein KGJ23_08715 [Euryarchaeota archaeon]|nr:hypothetical protein [Euryarchaeota archaeon]MDE1836685.1 hypothetical protein [Euryarchaeota archaeon]MDE1880286.1 hypothetical protein [Euryarchaeota archaeon]MDE2044655.1 hypothetical protein [Thermoplasmata archaeon]